MASNQALHSDVMLFLLRIKTAKQIRLDKKVLSIHQTLFFARGWDLGTRLVFGLYLALYAPWGKKEKHLVHIVCACI